MVDLLSSDDTSPTPIKKKSCVVRIAKMAMLDKIVDTEAAEPDDEKTDLDERMMCNEKDVTEPMTDVEENVGSRVFHM